MVKLIKIQILYLGLFIGVKVNAQTPYMSQSFLNTNYFNPAAVGFGSSNHFQTFFRNQFAGVGDPYRTIGVGADFALFSNVENEGFHNFGLGILGVSDQVLNGILQTNEITLSLANRVFFNENRSNFLSLGISSTIISRNIDRAALTFSDQYNSGRLFYNTSMEAVGNFPTTFSTNGGLLFSNNNKEAFMQFGGSIFYINRSSNTQIYGNANQSFQFISTLNLEHRLMEDYTYLLHASYQNRLESEYFYVGAALGLPIYSYEDLQNRFYVGCFYRTNDALVPYLGMMLSKYRLGVTYDVYQNKMTMSNVHPQTLEFTLTTNFRNRQSKNLRSVLN
jgi:type IX secretion system PorP/SprF family membrane protein